MGEQIDIAVDLGVVPPPLPEIMSLRQLVDDQARALARIAGGRRVAYSVSGRYLRTFEFARSLRWAENWVCRRLSHETGTNEGFSVLAGPETRRSAGRGSGWPTERMNG